ncbi:hypothetical protein AB0O38_09045 [Pseudarthrobacter oxydans]|uniref:hypothetical protein n=1 Tax=Pseudarthrobacter oxydans TaxID=1671 RepID=UPI00342B42D4
MQSVTLRSAKAQLSAAHRKDRNTAPEKIAELRRDYAAAKIAEFVEREVRKAPPLTEEQMAIISRAMRGATATG